MKGIFYAFDILVVGDRLLTGRPWSERRKELETIIKPSGIITLSQPVNVGKRRLYDLCIHETGCEGIVLKHVKSLYMAGFKKCITNPFWIKVKKDEPHQRAR